MWPESFSATALPRSLGSTQNSILARHVKSWAESDNCLGQRRSADRDTWAGVSGKPHLVSRRLE